MKHINLYILLFLFAISCQLRKDIDHTQITEKIRINQIGYEIDAPKRFIVADSRAENFEIINERGDLEYSGILVDNGSWEASGEVTKLGDFSKFKETGTFWILVEGEGISFPFIIGRNIFLDAAIDGLKSFFLQRASIDIEQKYAGVYGRTAGHPDTVCYYHESTGRTSGYRSSRGGWYDAGDYGKYMVNASLTVGTMLALYEIRPGIFQDGTLWIPESGNGKNDLLDEIKYELNWMRTMLDTDGGVFHKLTPKSFSAFVMPEEELSDRFIIGKSTAAALDYSAVMAMAARLYKEYDSSFARACLEDAVQAWNWASDNPEFFYEKNPPDIHTGAYNDIILKEEFFWAGAELYLSTGDETFYSRISEDLGKMQFRVEENWRNYVDNIGYYSLISPKSLLKDSDKQIIKKRLYAIADSLSTVIEGHPYRIPVNHFKWGSNSDFLNAAIIFAVAHEYSEKYQYKIMLNETLDYIFGKNATGFSFVTGYGSRTPVNIHHRPSAADGIHDPFPGFLVGGPNADRQDEENLRKSGKNYGYNEPARSYVDEVESFASNEIAINWNAPYVFVLGYLVDTSGEN